MQFLKYHEPTEARSPIFLYAFAGWSDAAESATHALHYLVKRLEATKFAEIDPEEFYDFSHTRPYTTRNRDGQRKIHWPSNKFSYWTGQNGSQGAMTFVGVEPSLRWRTYSRAIVDLAVEHGVKYHEEF